MKLIFIASLAFVSAAVLAAPEEARKSNPQAEVAKPCSTCAQADVPKGKDGWPTGLRLGVGFVSSKDDPKSRRKTGVTILHVQPGGAGERGGLKPGDIVIAIDKKSIDTQEQLLAELNARKLGETLNFSILRGTQELGLPIKF